MRKEIVAPHVEARRSTRDGWLDVERQASVELSSEDTSHPIEAAFRAGTAGWRAAEPGPQTIRLHFDTPQHLRNIRLVFRESHAPRTQEFVLRWSGEDGGRGREIVRQQYNFSPPGTTRQVEEYTVDLHGVTELELGITPDIHGGDSYASLEEWWLG
jgi:hypothetical protein